VGIKVETSIMLHDTMIVDMDGDMNMAMDIVSGVGRDEEGVEVGEAVEVMDEVEEGAEVDGKDGGCL
jgi:hypothetical protein